MIKLDQLKFQVDFNDDDILAECCQKLKINKSDIESFEIVKQAIDARRKPEVFYILNIALNLKNGLEAKFPDLNFVINKKLLSYEKVNSNIRPVIVGFGPSGMFCGLALAKMGLKPIIIEQGKSVYEREKDVNEFWNNRTLNKYSNVQFGEGGAGTFSDGKLNSNLDNDYTKIIINEFIHFGAPKQIFYISKPHIGSDNLKNIVVNLREEIKSLGGEILFSHKLQNINIDNEKVSSIDVLNIGNNKIENIKTQMLALCVGHSARDCFKMLQEKKLILKQKPFAMGVRIEQKQEDINVSQYGKGYNKNLPSADYKLAVHLDSGRSVFTFCMCPGGEIIAATSDEGNVVVNGMSMFSRNKENANSAVLVNVMPEDYNTTDELGGVYFQEKYENLAFELAGKNYNAPAESVGEFLGNKTKTSINASYRPQVTICDIKKCLPEFVTESLKEGLPLLNKKLTNFAKDENLLVAIESRSSCPLTIVRDENLESNIKGIFPCGEGAGYSGGIISSSQDGVKVAEVIYNNIKRLG